MLGRMKIVAVMNLRLPFFSYIPLLSLPPLVRQGDVIAQSCRPRTNGVVCFRCLFSSQSFRCLPPSLCNFKMCFCEDPVTGDAARHPHFLSLLFPLSFVEIALLFFPSLIFEPLFFLQFRPSFSLFLPLAFQW